MIILILLLLLFASPVYATDVPTIIQHVSTCNSGQATNPYGDNYSLTNTSGYYFKVPLPNPTQSGNALVLGFTAVCASSPTITISDDKSNKWVNAGFWYDTTHHKALWIWYALNVTAGTRLVQIHNSTSNAIDDFAANIAEFNNVATANAADGTAGYVGASSTTVTTNTGITPSVAGDLLYQVVARTTRPTTNATSYTAGSQSNISWRLLSADIGQTNQPLYETGGVPESLTDQWGQYSSTSSITPTMTMAPAAAYVTGALALKTATAGTARPSGIQVVGILCTAVYGTTYYGTNPSYAIVPTLGNLLAVAYTQANGSAISSITDSTGGSWQQLVSSQNPTTLSWAQIWYSPNHSASGTTTLTINYNNNLGAAGNLLWYDIIGASSSPAGNSNGAYGNQTGNSSTLTTTTLTPSHANSVIISCVNQQYNTETGVNLGYFDSDTFDGMPIDGWSNLNQNGGYAHYYSPNTSAITSIWNLLVSNGHACQQWRAVSGEFVAPVSSVPSPPSNLRIQ